MFSRLLPLVLFAVPSVCLAQGEAAPPADRPLAKNAALQYWLAFSMLPELTEEETERFGRSGYTEAPLDATARGLVERSKVSLQFLARGAAVRDCDWGQDLLTDGPQLLLPQLSKARRLAGLACLRARVRFADGDVPGALDDLHHGRVLARHCTGSEGLLVSLLVQIAIESWIDDVLESHLDDLDPATRRQTADRLATVPKGGSFEQAILAERRGIADWMIRQAKADPGAFRKNLAGFGLEVPDAGKPEAVAAKLREFQGHYDEIIEIAKGPEEEFAAKWNALSQRAVKENVFAAVALPAVGRVYERVARHERDVADLVAKLRGEE